MNTNIKAVFFDIGGTLVEKSRNKERDPAIINEMARLLKFNGTDEHLVEMICQGEAKYKEWRGQTLNELPLDEKWARFLLPGFDEVFIRQNAQQVQQMWSASKGSKHVKPYVPVVLKEISERGYALGTISHSSPRYLDEPGLGELFNVKVHAPEFGKRKPHPSLFVDAARQLGLPPQQCAYVGDNPWRDVVGPREAGFEMVVLMRNGSGVQEPGADMMQPDLVIHDLRELLDYLPPRIGKNVKQVREGEEMVLYDVALSTMWWNKEVYTADEFFEMGRQIGFARFELNHQIPPEVFERIDTSRFSIGSLHDPCPAVIAAKMLEQSDVQITSLNEELRRKGVDVVKHTIDQACRMHARLVVVHPGRIAGSHTMDDQLRVLYRAGRKGSDEYEAMKRAVITDRAARAEPHLDRCLESLSEIIAFADGCGLMIGLENRFHYYELPVYNEIDRMLDAFKQPWVGWQFDVGHLQVHHQLGLLDFEAWLEKFGGRIVGIHLHDVIGIVDHQSPGCGDVDFHRISRYLPRDAYRTAEIDKTVTCAELADGMNYLAQCGCVNII